MNKVEIDTKAIYFILFFIFTHFLDQQKLKAQLLIKGRAWKYLTLKKMLRATSF